MKEGLWLILVILFVVFEWINGHIDVLLKKLCVLSITIVAVDWRLLWLEWWYMLDGIDHLLFIGIMYVVAWYKRNTVAGRTAYALVGLALFMQGLDLIDESKNKNTEQNPSHEIQFWAGIILITITAIAALLGFKQYLLKIPIIKTLTDKWERWKKKTEKDL